MFSGERFDTVSLGHDELAMYLETSGTMNILPHSSSDEQFDEYVAAEIANLEYDNHGILLADKRESTVDKGNREKEEPEDNCAICLDVLSDRDVVGYLKECNHFFHYGCITTWITNHASCPSCRTVVPRDGGLEMCWLTEAKDHLERVRPEQEQYKKSKTSTRGFTLRQMYEFANFFVFREELPKLARLTVHPTYKKAGVKLRDDGSVSISLPKCVSMHEQRKKLYSVLIDVYELNHTSWSLQLWYRYKTFVVE